MDLHYIRELVDWLNAEGVIFERGLTDEEIATLEATHALRFPSDLRKLLQHALPVSDRFPNWRGRAAALRESLNWPAEGILREVERYGVWLPAWGERPHDPEAMLAQARRSIETAPRLIPVYAHRYLPCDPPTAGNPIFSVIGTDVIYAGCDLPSFFTAEFGVPCPTWAASSPRPVAFWDDLVA